MERLKYNIELADNGVVVRGEHGFNSTGTY